MKRSDKELDIIAAMAFDASMSISAVAKKTGLKDHVVRHALKRLLDEDVIRLRPYVNPYALGLMEFHAEVVLETPGEAALQDLIRAFVESPTCTFVSEVAGDFHLSVMFLARSLADIPRFMDEICQRVPHVKFRKSISPVIEVVFAHPNRAKKNSKNTTLSYFAGVSPQKYDELDQKILILLGSGAMASRRELSKQAGVPLSTLDYRIQTLQQRGILLAIGYMVPTYHDGLSQYALRIVASRPSAKLHQLMIELTETHQAVRFLLHLSGTCDYVLGVRFSEPARITSFTQELHRYLDSSVATIESIPELRMHKTYVNPEDLHAISSLTLSK